MQILTLLKLTRVCVGRLGEVHYGERVHGSTNKYSLRSLHTEFSFACPSLVKESRFKLI